MTVPQKNNGEIYMKKKTVAIILILSVAIGLFSACSGKTADNGTKKLKIVCTLFPMYDWVMNILGEQKENADVILLLDNGADLHSYQPTADDIVAIQTADIFVYAGGESDKWVNDLSATVDMSDVASVNLLEILGSSVVEEVTVEGMESEEPEEGEDGEEEPEYDEHVWLSLRNAEKVVEKLTAVICSEDSVNSSVYEQNSADYLSRLSELDELYKTTLSEARLNTLIFADRFPFRYLCEDYKLEYYAAFSGCSAECEAAFSTVTFLADKVNETGTTAVVITETSDGRIAETVKSTSGNSALKILTLNAMQSVTAEKIASSDYYNIMSENLNVLKEALA